MTTQEKIDYLKAAEIAFRKEPNFCSYNLLGLCAFFYDAFKLKQYEIEDLLREKDIDNYYKFGKHMTQYKIYRDGREYLKFERADWCKAEIERLEKEI